MTRNRGDRGSVPGLTLRSLAALVFALLVMGMIAVFGESIDGSSGQFAIHALPLPAIMVFLGLSLASALVYLLRRRHILTRPEMLSVLFALLIAAPLMSEGFWARIVGFTATIPRSGDFEKFDAYAYKLWPHGENLVTGALSESNKTNITERGNVSWEEREYEAGQQAVMPVLRNTEAGGTSSIRFDVPLSQDGDPWLYVDQPYLVAVLAHASELGPGAFYFCRVYYDGNPQYAEEPFTGRSPGPVNFLHQKGFERRGIYGLTFASGVEERITLEFGLSGAGTVAFHDPVLMDVGALETLYRGRPGVSSEVYAELPPKQRAGLIVKPDNMFSLAGLRYIVAGHIPIGPWLPMIISWLTYVMLLALACYSIAVIMRRQWVESERYPLPLMQIPSLLVGGPDGQGRALPPIWRNRVMWAGFALALFWCLMRGWAAYNPNVPNMNIDIQLKPYFNSPHWGKMWLGSGNVGAVRFRVTAIFLSLAMFMELNILMTLVIGFFAFRSQFWFGEATGLAIDPQFPYYAEQQAGAYIAYALLVIAFTRKYLWKVLKSAVTGRDFAEGQAGVPAHREAMSYRSAVLLFVGAFAGIIVWAQWVELPVPGMVVFFGFMVMIGFVAAKLRAECGPPFCYYFPSQAVLIVSLAGGLSFFGPRGAVFATLASGVIGYAAFFLIPGLQVELVELGGRFRIKRSHILGVCVLGILGGIVIGGWVFLSGLYGFSGDEVQNTQILGEKRQDFKLYNTELTKANSMMVAGANAGEDGVEKATWGYVYGGALTAAVALLRQAFAGFWFHPIGVLLGPSRLLNEVWGSVLAAWVIRSIVLRLGGAATVRNKLLPFFVGVFLAGVSAHVVFFFVNAIVFFFNPGAGRAGGVY